MFRVLPTVRRTEPSGLPPPRMTYRGRRTTLMQRPRPPARRQPVRSELRRSPRGPLPHRVRQSASLLLAQPSTQLRPRARPNSTPLLIRQRRRMKARPIPPAKKRKSRITELAVIRQKNGPVKVSPPVLIFLAMRLGVQISTDSPS